MPMRALGVEVATSASFDLHFNLISTSLLLNHFHIAEMQVKTK